MAAATPSTSSVMPPSNCDTQLADCRSCDPLVSIIQQSWSNFDGMWKAIHSFALSRGFIARHKVKGTTHYCGRARPWSSSARTSFPSFPASISSSPSPTSVPAHPAPPHPTERLPEAIVLSGSSSSEASTMPASAAEADTTVPSSQSSVAPGQVALRMQRCRSAGCIPQRGVFQCEFAARTERHEDEEREQLLEGHSGVSSHSAKAWQMLCNGERKCRWSIRYRFDFKRKCYLLTLIESAHDGHRFRQSEAGAGQRVLECGDLTPVMKDSVGTSLDVDGGDPSEMQMSPDRVFLEWMAGVHECGNSSSLTVREEWRWLVRCWKRSSSS